MDDTGDPHISVEVVGMLEDYTFRVRLADHTFRLRAKSLADLLHKGNEAFLDWNRQAALEVVARLRRYE